ncbi:MAG: hypothetical protein OEV27_03895 [Nitrospira sp.]|nr:hypothetical protein [Nitrospira sp.]MDH4250309.1 hypothetical protein [Nitrospira sp.]MDH5334992.1 hypothetical protein [Nitrospira sp.]
MNGRHIATSIGIALLVGAGFGMSPEKVQAQTLSQYTSEPPFLTEAVAPNILLLMDMSGSMRESAYHRQGEAYNPATTYYGYFSHLHCYSYGSSKFTPGAARAAVPNTCIGSDKWDGNFLNYISHDRFEIVKWVMMGGKCAPRAINGTCYPGGKLFLESDELVDPVDNLNGTGFTPYNSAMCFDRAGSDLQVYNTGCGSGATSFKLTTEIASEPQGVLQQIGDKARFGLMKFNKQTGGGSADGGKIVAEMGSGMTSMVNAIENSAAEGFTPLAESLYEATRYFAQIPPAYVTSDYSYNVQNKDPYYYTSPWSDSPQYVKCCKSFVMIFTDGQPTKDTNVPASIRDHAHTAASHAPVGFVGHCPGGAGCTEAHSSAPHISHGGGMVNHGANGQIDHHDNCSAYYGGLSADTCTSEGSHYLDDVAYYAHTTDLRQATLPVLGEAGKNIDGFQNLIVYTFYAFGTASNILKDAAKYGAFEDRNNNSVFDAGDVWDQYNNYTGGLGADGLPDAYFESSNAEEMRDRFVAAINSILRRSQSGTSISVLATSGTGEGALYQSFFYPGTSEPATNADVRWTGFTQGLWVDKFGNIREDTLEDNKLTLADDYIVKTIIDPTTGDVGVQRFVDSNADGEADNPAAPLPTIPLREVKGIWEAGKQLAKLDHASRRILTWVDANNDGVVDSGKDTKGQTDGTHTAASGEVIPFTTASAALLKEYLRADADAPTTNPFKSTDIIQFIRGCYDTSASGPCPMSAQLRDRRLTVPGVGLAVWKFGDPVHSTPTIVSQPRESYDFIYGDPGYLNFFKRWKNRRHVAYVGANDGMLHAFNGGFYNRGDDASTTGVVEHGWFSNTPTSDGRGQELGDELWGLIPYQLLPHLRWLAQADYTHVYYVDLKPKVTDVRIFTPEPACSNPVATGCIHPNGWGTILIGGFRMGGSCGACGAGGAPPMTVSIGGTNRTFYTAYFALDITDPDAEPKLLWSFSDAGMGLSTSYPAIIRMNPPGPNTCPLTGPCDDVWLAVFGSGATGYEGQIGQTGKFYAVDIKVGPKTGTGGSAANVFTTFPIKSASGGDLNTFVGDLVSVDRDLDYRADAVYGGSVINDGSLPWRGRMYRLTAGGCDIAPPCSSSTWGYDLLGSHVPTEVLDNFSPYPSGTAIQAGPMVAAPGLAVDDANNLWLFFGTGRFFGNPDKTNSESQRLYGVKDSVLSNSCTEGSIDGCKATSLVNVSDVAVCVVCATGTNQVTSTALGSVTKLEGTDPTTTLQGLVQSKDGWFTNLTTTRERSITSPTVLGGIVFYPTYVPQDDLCISAGDGYLYGLFYQTGSAMSTPVLGTSASGSSTMSNARVDIGQGTGMLSVMAVHIGAQGGGTGGAGTGGKGCQSGITGMMQSSAGLTNTICTNPGAVTSRFIAWINLRE